MTEIPQPTPQTTKEVTAVNNAPAPEKVEALAAPVATTSGEKPAAAKRTARKTPASATAEKDTEMSTSGLSDKETKVKKSKLVRDSFTIPKDEYLVVDLLKQRTAQLGHPAKKSELLRAGIKLLAGLSDTALRKAVLAVPAIKTGRPRAEKPSETVEKTKAKSSKK